MEMNKITEVTRRNIFDGLTFQKVNWAGRLNEVQFLTRLFDLKELPSTDHRFRDAGQDIWQHRVNNYDWENDWVFYDPRFNLLHCEDEVFLRFLCETIHPIVRSDDEEIKKLLRLYNEHLQTDGFEIVEYARISERPIFKEKELSSAAKTVQRFEELDMGETRKSDLSQRITGSSELRQLRVFLCHASNDKPVARELYHRLSKHNFAPWLDEKNLLPGQNFELEIRKAVRNSDVILVLLSDNSITKIGYVQKEIKQALDIAEEQPEGSIFLIPVRLGECSVPERLKHLHWVNLFDEGGYDLLVHALKKRETELRGDFDAKLDGLLTNNKNEFKPQEMVPVWAYHILYRLTHHQTDVRTEIIKAFEEVLYQIDAFGNRHGISNSDISQFGSVVGALREKGVVDESKYSIIRDVIQSFDLAKQMDDKQLNMDVAKTFVNKALALEKILKE